MVSMVQDLSRSSHKLLIEHLKSNGDLKGLPDIIEELESKARQQVVMLQETVEKKNEVLKEANRQNWTLSNKVDVVTSQREEAELELRKLTAAHQKRKLTC